MNLKCLDWNGKVHTQKEPKQVEEITVCAGK